MADNVPLTYNLIDRPCVLVETEDGTRQELSIREAFRQANHIRGIVGDEPLQTVALLRLFVAITYGAYPEDSADNRGESIAQWEEMWRNLKQDGGDPRIDEYLTRYHDRFDLFDAEKPFMQVAGLRFKKPKRPSDTKFALMSKLRLSVPANDRAFSKAFSATLITPACAARNLIELQAWDVSGRKNSLDDRDGDIKVERNSPAGTGWCGNQLMIVLEGPSLADTIALNHAKLNAAAEAGASDESFQWSDDRPLWERPVQDACGENGYCVDKVKDRNKKKDYDDLPRFMHGPATLMTWQTRRVLLHHDSHGMVTGAIVANGDRNLAYNGWPMETMSSWENRRWPNNKVDPFTTPVKTDATKQLWRGMESLIPDSVVREDHKYPPLTVCWLKILQAFGSDDIYRLPVTVRSVGVAYGNRNAVIDDIVNDSLDMDVSLLTTENPEERQELLNGIQICDKYMEELVKLSRNLDSCTQNDDDNDDTKGKGKGKGAKAKAREAREKRVKARTWATLDAPFRRILANTTTQTDIDRGSTKSSITESMDEWYKQAHRIFVDAGTRLAQEAGPAAAKGRIINEGKSVINAGTCLRKYYAAIKQIKEGRA